MVGCNDKPKSELGHNENSETSEKMKEEEMPTTKKAHIRKEEGSEEEGVVEISQSNRPRP